MKHSRWETPTFSHIGTPKSSKRENKYKKIRNNQMKTSRMIDKYKIFAHEYQKKSKENQYLPIFSRKNGYKPNNEKQQNLWAKNWNLTSPASCGAERTQTSSALWSPFFSSAPKFSQDLERFNQTLPPQSLVTCKHGDTKKQKRSRVSGAVGIGPKKSSCRK